MARPINPDDPESPGDPGMPGTPTPPTQPGTKIALQVSSTNATITADQIIAAGGPWASFKVRVTPLNANGVGPSQTVEATVTETPVDYDGGNASGT